MNLSMNFQAGHTIYKSTGRIGYALCLISLAPVYTHRHTNQTGLMATGMMRRTDILEKCLEVKHYHNYPDTISQYSDTQTDRQDFITKQNSENLEVSDVCEQSCKHFLRLLSCMPLEQWKQYAYKVLTKSLIFSASPHFQIPYLCGIALLI